MISVTRDTFRLAEVFTIARGSRTEAQVLTVRAFANSTLRPSTAPSALTTITRALWYQSRVWDPDD